MEFPIIEIKNVSKKYESTVIFNNLNLSIYHGEFLTLLGPSGCGKTTLLRLISGFEKLSGGSIYMDGKRIDNLPPQYRNVHTIFQNYALFPHLSVYENIAFPLRCKKISDLEIYNRIQETLKLVQLESFSQYNVQRLSGGQQQRVAIARAIINKPRVLLLDEPLNSLDYKLRKIIQQELKQLQKTLNMTFMFVTHDREEALSMSDRIIILNQGNIEQIGSPKELYETPINLYVAKFIGEANIFPIKVLAAKNQYFLTEIESIKLYCKNTKNYKINEKLNLVIRPEDVRVRNASAVYDTKNMLPGKIVDIIYKGPTIDLTVQLLSGKIIYASEFFNENNDKLEYSLYETVLIYWSFGWEVILPDEV